jgi:hypothetical protein
MYLKEKQKNLEYKEKIIEKPLDVPGKWVYIVYWSDH